MAHLFRWLGVWFAGLMVLSANAHPARTEAQFELGVEDDAAPWSYADGSGFANDLVRQAMLAAGYEVKFKVMPYARCKALALRGLLAGCFSTSQTPELTAQLLFPRQSVFDAHNVLVARADNPMTDCTPQTWPRPQRLGIVRSYEYTPQVENLLRSPQTIRHEADSEVSNLRKLESGRLDATFITLDDVKRLEWVTALAGIRAPMKILCRLGKQAAYVAFSPKHPQGRQAQRAFEVGFESLLRQGQLKRLQQSWQVHALERTRAKPH